MRPSLAEPIRPIRQSSRAEKNSGSQEAEDYFHQFWQGGGVCGTCASSRVAKPLSSPCME